MRHLVTRLRQEEQELFFATVYGDMQAIMDECLDVANFAWFIHEKARGAIIKEQKKLGVCKVDVNG